MIKKINFSLGQTMVEMVVAIGMVALVLVAIVSGVSLSVRNSRFSKNKALATRYSQEAVEKFRNYRDTHGWEPFKDEVFGAGTSRTYCLDTVPSDMTDLSGFVGNCVSQKIPNTQGDTEFSREATANLILAPSEKADFSIKVFWLEGSREHSVTLDAQLYSWSL